MRGATPEPWIKEAHDKSKARVAQVEVSCNVSAAEIKVDGANAGASPHTTWLLPGEHTFEASKTGYVTKGETKALLAGTAIKIEILLAPEVTGVGGPDDVKRDGLPVWPGVLGIVVGAVGVGVGSALLVVGSSKDSDAEQAGSGLRCSPSNLSAECNDLQSTIDSRDTLHAGGLAAVIAGGAVLTFGVAWTIAAATSGSDNEGARVDILPLAGAVNGLGLRIAY